MLVEYTLYLLLHVSLKYFNHFPFDLFELGVDYSSNSNKLLLQIHASDPDSGVNGSLSYFIRSSNLYHMGSNISSGSVVPSPFHVTTDGRLMTDSLMAEYNQDRFVLEVVAREEAAPFREDSANVHIWVYEPSQLSKIVVSTFTFYVPLTNNRHLGKWI